MSISLESLFRECGIALHIEKVEVELPYLPGGRSYELADLYAALNQILTRTAASSLMSDSVSDLSWVAHALIVPDLLIIHHSRYRRPLGLMFDTNSAWGRSGRQGCAIAYQRVRTEPRLYLRTIAHELGHIFNLGHPGEGTEPFSPDAINTVMIPTENLRPRHQIPDTLEFRFAAAQRHWLVHAPDRYVCPGGAEYGSRPPNWSAALIAPDSNK
jgi:hypothetical protein